MGSPTCRLRSGNLVMVHGLILLLLPLFPLKVSSSRLDGIPPDTGLTHADGLSLLQTRARFEHSSSIPRLTRLLPIAWVHVPKTGTAFVNTLIHTPEVCNGIAPNLLIGRGQNFTWPFMFMQHYGAACAFVPMQEYALGQHWGFGPLYEQHKGRAMIFLRQPEQRIMSAWRHGQHDWPYSAPAETALQFAKVVNGCSVRMLTRGGRTLGRNAGKPSPCGGPKPPTEAEVELAIRRLREGFAFVGITDRWDLSICLYHTMFGGDCKAWERFPNTVHDIAELHGFKDAYDTKVWNEANNIFNERLRIYGVSESSCAACFRRAKCRHEFGTDQL